MSQVQRLRESLCIKKLDKQVWCRIKPSSVHGVGIFAIKDIPKGTDPFVDSYMGDQISLIDKKKLSGLSTEIKTMLEDYWPTNGNKEAIVPLYPNTLVWTNYLNYTDDEKKNNIHLNDQGKWETLRDIKEGEELLENPLHHFNSDGTFKIRQVTHKKYLTLA